MQINRNFQLGLFLFAVLVNLAISATSYAGVISISASKTTGTISDDKFSIVITDSEKVTLKATVDTGTVSLTFTPSTGLSKTSDNGSGTKTQTAEFAFDSSCVGIHNTIDVNIGHTKDNNGGSCLPNGKSVTFHIFIPKIIINTSNWSQDNAAVSRAFQPSEPPTIGELYDGFREVIPFEYKVTIADGIPSAAGISASDLDIYEYCADTTITTPSSGNPTSDGPYPVETTYRGTANTADAGTASNPIFYAVDAPGPIKSAVEGDISRSNGGISSITHTATLICYPMFRGKAVGSGATRTFSITATSGSPVIWSGSHN